MHLPFYLIFLLIPLHGIGGVAHGPVGVENGIHDLESIKTLALGNKETGTMGEEAGDELKLGPLERTSSTRNSIVETNRVDLANDDVDSEEAEEEAALLIYCLRERESMETSLVQSRTMTGRQQKTLVKRGHSHKKCHKYNGIPKRQLWWLAAKSRLRQAKHHTQTHFYRFSIRCREMIAALTSKSFWKLWKHKMRWAFFRKYIAVDPPTCAPHDVLWCCPRSTASQSIRSKDGWLRSSILAQQSTEFHNDGTTTFQLFPSTRDPNQMIHFLKPSVAPGELDGLNELAQAPSKHLCCIISSIRSAKDDTS
ncbi:hypothetical protein PSHT_16421, partial [Puccinia striiformis]